MVRVQGTFICDDFDDPKIGLPVELVVEKLNEDENGNEIVAHIFKLIKPSEKNATDKAVVDG
jgi:uncharacterized OB-fold protein